MVSGASHGLVDGEAAGGRLGRRLAAAGLVVGAVLLYSVWITGCTFRFDEIERFPNHQMLAEAFAAGRLWIDEEPRVDVVLYRGRRYLYFGPVPAALRAPLAMLGVAVPTGLMVALLAAAAGVVFTFALREIAPGGGRRRRVRRLFVLLFAGNGLTLFMVTVPSVHHESILWAALFLLLATVGLLRSWRRGATPAGGALVGVASALAVGSRISYLVPALVVVGAFAVAAWSAAERRHRTRAIGAAVTPLLVMGALLAGYNAARFGSATEFGLDHLTSRYQEYIRGGHFWRLDHVPYNVWDYLCRPPQLTDTVPFLEATITMQRVTQLSATPSQEYELIHVNELAVSVFAVLPALLLLAPALRLLDRDTPAELRRPAALLAAVAVLQLGVLSLTFASTARYEFDFVPPLLLLAFLGAVRLSERGPGVARAVAALAVAALVVGLFLPLSAVEAYEPFLGFRNPLLDLIGRPGPG